MTDAEVIKCLACRMPFDKVCVEAYDLINRQKAEIERLQKESNQFADIGKMYSEIKADAIKEFAELIYDEITNAIINNNDVIENRVKKHNANRYEDGFCMMCDGKITALGGIKYFIKNLVKEMVGDT